MQRGVRAVGLVLATAAAIAVFAVGNRDGSDWTVPALVLIGVLVLVLQAATSMPPRAVATTVAPAPPHPMAVASDAPASALTGTATSSSYVPGLPQVNIPAGSFPDPGHSHGPVIAVTEDRPPPPLHEVLRPVADDRPG